MTRTHRRIAAWALVAATLAGGCAPIVRNRGHVLDEDALQAIEVGIATQDDVFEALGSPSSVNTFGEPTWYYVSARTERTAFFEDELIEQSVVAVVFDESGTVASVDRYGVDDRWDLALVEAETPTHGKQLGVLQQLLGNIGRFSGSETPDNPARRRP
ncbi:MAG: outer membrane protein assembly factor BamE [Alphaproteobacteria bacterium]|nr:outer membrane protein assembly factor BamE [Alphaproteobacteria bacterium]